MRKLFFFNFIVFVSINIFGCHPNVQQIGAYDKDVTHVKKYWGGYVPNHEYKVKIDLFLKDVLLGNETVVAIVAPNSYPCRLYSSPDTVTEYLKNPNLWPTVKGVIKEGTLVRCTMIRKSGTWLWPQSISVWGQIVDGSHKGVIVKLNDISDYGENHTYSPDERFLEEIGLNSHQ